MSKPTDAEGRHVHRCSKCDGEIIDHDETWRPNGIDTLPIDHRHDYDCVRELKAALATRESDLAAVRGENERFSRQVVIERETAIAHADRANELAADCDKEIICRGEMEKTITHQRNRIEEMVGENERWRERHRIQVARYALAAQRAEQAEQERDEAKEREYPGYKREKRLRIEAEQRAERAEAALAAAEQALEAMVMVPPLDSAHAKKWAEKTLLDIRRTAREGLLQGDGEGR